MAGFLIFYRDRSPSVSPDADNVVPTTRKWETKSDEQTNVTVTVTPIELSIDSTEWKFDIAMDTHSVELNQDLTKIAVLVDDQSKEYLPTKWDGASGGHHKDGMLIFAPIKPYPQHLKLNIRGIAGADRLFSWTLIEE